MGNIVKTAKRKIKQYLSIKKTVDFVICGTQKGGTSALDAYLREHPEICMADVKEVHYFDNEKEFSSGKPDYSNYHMHFSPKKNHRMMGEATPIYMYWDHAPKRLYEYNPDMKLIILLRNPIERAYSHWNMERSRNAEILPFFEAITNEKERCHDALPLQHRVYSYVDRGFYLKQLKKIWTYFPKNRVLILKSEDLKQKHKETLNLICDFLQVSHFNAMEAKNVHSRPYESRISEKEKVYLKSVFEKEIREIEQALNWDCSEWFNV